MGISRVAAAAGSAAAITVGLLAGTTTGAHAAPTCRGQEATIVGSPDQYVLRGTSGADVIVTNGSEEVYTYAGDDVVCATDGANPLIKVHRGDDVVDATDHRGDSVTANLGPGSDTYIGSSHRDVVKPGVNHTTTDQDRISTRKGWDEVRVPVQYAGRLRALLGRGKDVGHVTNARGMARVYGGRGPDLLQSHCFASRQARRCTTLKARLDTGVLRRDGVKRARVRGFRHATLDARRVRAHGTWMRNEIEIDACSGVAYGRAGRDVIQAFPFPQLRCSTRSMSFYGQGGDDVLRGSGGPDRLYGGRARDLTDGRAGRDVCRAERKRRCEA